MELIETMRQCMNLTLALFVLSSMSCASSSEKKLDKEIASQPTIESRAELRDHATTLIESSTSLSADQKVKLMKLKSDTRLALDKKNQESLQLRNLLIQEVLISKYDPEKVTSIKEKIQKNEEGRIQELFKAIDQANTILGRDQELRRLYFETLFEGGRQARY